MAVTRDNPNQFYVKFDEIARRGLGRVRRQEVVQVDPYLIARAVSQVMRSCTVRSATGRAILWNEYRVILSRRDFEGLGPLRAALETDLEEALTREAGELSADLFGALRVSVVLDEGDELAAGHAVIRTAFVRTERAPAAAAGPMTMRFDPAQRAHREAAQAGQLERPAPAPATAYCLEWQHGHATLPPGVTVVVGRPHPQPPGRFIALEGASERINKQHFVLTTGPAQVNIGRLPSSNPVHVDGQLLRAGSEMAATPRVEISLSKGDLVLVLSRL